VRIYESTPKRLICDAEHENYPCATVRALTPVADPDPHTTSEKETT
jgi:hypothetical protein